MEANQVAEVVVSNMDYIKVFAAALALLPVLGIGFGLSSMFSTTLNAISRNPGANDKIFRVTLIGAGFIEALGLMSVLIAILILIL